MCAKICPTVVALIDHKYYFHRIPRPGSEKSEKPSEIGIPKPRVLPKEIPKVVPKAEETPVKTSDLDVQENKEKDVQDEVPETSDPDEEELSEYEKIRQQNIAERRAKFNELKLSDKVSDLSKSVNQAIEKAQKRKAPPKEKEVFEPVRKSLRLQKIDTEELPSEPFDDFDEPTGLISSEDSDTSTDPDPKVKVERSSEQFDDLFEPTGLISSEDLDMITDLDPKGRKQFFNNLSDDDDEEIVFKKSDEKPASRIKDLVTMLSGPVLSKEDAEVAVTTVQSSLNVNTNLLLLDVTLTHTKDSEEEVDKENEKVEEKEVFEPVRKSVRLQKIDTEKLQSEPFDDFDEPTGLISSEDLDTSTNPDPKVKAVEDKENEKVDENSEKKVYPCVHCDIICDSAPNLLNHVLETHEQKTEKAKKPKEKKSDKGKYQYPCANCDTVCDSANDLVLHWEAKHDDSKEQLDCSRCDKVFKTQKQLIQHEYDEHKIPKYRCDKCDQKFKSNNDLKCHKLAFHESKIEDFVKKKIKNSRRKSRRTM